MELVLPAGDIGQAGGQACGDKRRGTMDGGDTAGSKEVDMLVKDCMCCLEQKQKCIFKSREKKTYFDWILAD